VLAYVSRVRGIGCSVDEDKFTMEDVESNIVRCPDQEAAQKMIDGEAGCLKGAVAVAVAVAVGVGWLQRLPMMRAAGLRDCC